MAMTNFRAIDMLKATPNTQAAPAPAAAEPEPKYEEVEAIEAPEDESSVPNGPAADVLRWVGNDKARAAHALEQEQAGSAPRKGLSTELQEILDK